MPATVDAMKQELLKYCYTSHVTSLLKEARASTLGQASKALHKYLADSVSFDPYAFSHHDKLRLFFLAMNSGPKLMSSLACVL